MKPLNLIKGNVDLAPFPQSFVKQDSVQKAAAVDDFQAVFKDRIRKGKIPCHGTKCDLRYNSQSSLVF